MKDTIFTSESCMGYHIHLVNIVWDTASTSSQGYLLVNNVGYDIHWDTGFTLTPASDA